MKHRLTWTTTTGEIWRRRETVCALMCLLMIEVTGWIVTCKALYSLLRFRQMLQTDWTPRLSADGSKTHCKSNPRHSQAKITFSVQVKSPDLSPIKILFKTESKELGKKSILKTQLQETQRSPDAFQWPGWWRAFTDTQNWMQRDTQTSSNTNWLQ